MITHGSAENELHFKDMFLTNCTVLRIICQVILVSCGSYSE